MPPTTGKDPPRRGMDIGVQVDLPTGGRRGLLGTSLYWVLALGVLALAMVPVYDYGMGFLESRGFFVPPEMMEDIGMDGVIMFKQHDRNNDGLLSLDEFEPLAHRLMQINETYSYDSPIEDEDEVITLETFFQPLQLETMTKDMDSQLIGNLDSLLGLKTWKKPHEEWLNFGARQFRGFLPTDPHLMESVGEVYFLVQPPEPLSQGGALSSNRYMPPQLMDDADIIIHRLLLLLHPRPFVMSRFAPQGSVAVVRATNDKYVDIMFRIHAEFQLNEPPFYPFWFTPAQFTGHVIMHKDGTRVLDFDMYVPTDKRLNVDMEWLNGPKEGSNMEVDIGYMPQMALKATRGSVQVMHGGKDVRTQRLPSTDDYEKSISGIQWKKEISEAEAARSLEVKLYPFKKVVYYNFTNVYPKAQELNKPVHSILLWGALDDQSC